MKLHQVLFIVVVSAAAILFTRWVFNAVMAANIPDWMKYIILR